MPQNIPKVFRKLLAKTLDSIILKTEPSLARSLEWRLQRAQGKGIGYASVIDETRTVHEFIQILGITNVCLFDVGANTGQYGLQLKSRIPGIELHSFEPSHTAFEKLKKVASVYENWKVYHLGLGSECTELELFAMEAGSASASLLKRDLTFGREEFIKSEMVQIETLDRFLSNNPLIRPNILKLDVEGFELRCLEGAKDSISQLQIIQFEFGEVNIDARIFFRDFWNFFNANGFDLYRITRNRPIKIKSYTEDLETFSVTNYLAIKS
jgi:FkbM family methyltransferase